MTTIDVFHTTPHMRVRLAGDARTMAGEHSEQTNGGRELASVIWVGFGTYMARSSIADSLLV